MATKDEVITALSETLQMRNECPECGGSGTNWVDIDGEAEAEPCSCTSIAFEVLKQYNEEILEAVTSYLKEKGYDIGKVPESEAKALVNELLGEDRILG